MGFFGSRETGNYVCNEFNLDRYEMISCISILSKEAFSLNAILQEEFYAEPKIDTILTFRYVWFNLFQNFAWNISKFAKLGSHKF